MQPNDKPTYQAVGTLSQLATAAGGNQVPNGSNVAKPMQLPPDFAQAPLSSLTVNSDFRAFAAAGANTPTKGSPAPASIPQTSEPDLSQQSFAPINTQGTVLSGGK